MTRGSVVSASPERALERKVPCVVSLSHVALPSLHGKSTIRRALAAKGSRTVSGKCRSWPGAGSATVSPDCFFCLRYNPFFDYLEKRALDWLDATNGAAM